MQYRTMEPHLVTADAELDDLRLRPDGALELLFRDWRNVAHRATFDDVVAFRWDPLGQDGAPRNDEAYEVVGSEWMSELQKSNQVTAGVHRHFKLCFNAANVLDVICADVKVDAG